jgi:hypothetical protein
MKASNKSRKEKTSGNTIDLTMFIPNGNAEDDGIEREKKIEVLDEETIPLFFIEIYLYNQINSSLSF